MASDEGYASKMNVAELERQIRMIDSKILFHKDKLMVIEMKLDALKKQFAERLRQ